jgi:hypothetical protein
MRLCKLDISITKLGAMVFFIILPKVKAQGIECSITRRATEGIPIIIGRNDMPLAIGTTRSFSRRDVPS